MTGGAGYQPAAAYQAASRAVDSEGRLVGGCGPMVRPTRDE